MIGHRAPGSWHGKPEGLILQVALGASGEGWENENPSAGQSSLPTLFSLSLCTHLGVGLGTAGTVWPTPSVGPPSWAVKDSSGLAYHIGTSLVDGAKRQGVVSMGTRGIKRPSLDLSSATWAER